MAVIKLTPAALDRLYATLPTIDCQRKCQDCCSLILMSVSESDRIRDHLGHPMPEANCDNPQAPLEERTYTCAMLSAEGLCSVWPIRPAICRLWGVTEVMRCPFGCQPQPRYLSEQEAHRFLLRVGSLTKAPMSEAQAAQMLRHYREQHGG